MIEIIETMPTRTTTKSGIEVDAIEHRRELCWDRGEVRHVKRALNRRFRRETRQLLRRAGY
ncbi:MAG TPA: hypothetical protein VFU47_04410 [Armatimonadota bacterium]|nr:hypothetical protein [Armatimonadota bacterium]